MFLTAFNSVTRHVCYAQRRAAVYSLMCKFIYSESFALDLHRCHSCRKSKEASGIMRVMTDG